ncbi:hypothetical protein BC938DRAFT_483069 [Jimgerdemannia flammicorona]|uniref:Uncharacterized protein n=1 Tax=Jimgerdemannia flammicorona TaxID=994334 RepID=A0A433QVX2_9FUNG|nr:hypothetical protein BC938DRAFT_483069 [Jimgerdemannia flammicorona]
MQLRKDTFGVSENPLAFLSIILVILAFVATRLSATIVNIFNAGISTAPVTIISTTTATVISTTTAIVISTTTATVISTTTATITPTTTPAKHRLMSYVWRQNCPQIFFAWDMEIPDHEGRKRGKGELGGEIREWREIPAGESDLSDEGFQRAEISPPRSLYNITPVAEILLQIFFYTVIISLRFLAENPPTVEIHPLRKVNCDVATRAQIGFRRRNSRKHVTVFLPGTTHISSRISAATKLIFFAEQTADIVGESVKAQYQEH